MRLVLVFIKKIFHAWMHNKYKNTNYSTKKSLFDCYLVIWILVRSHFNFDKKDQKHQYQDATSNRCYQRQQATVASYSTSITLKCQTNCTHEPIYDTFYSRLNMSTTNAHTSTSFVIPCLNRLESSTLDMIVNAYHI